jgi:hypothetical protein
MFTPFHLLAACAPFLAKTPVAALSPYILRQHGLRLFYLAGFGQKRFGCVWAFLARRAKPYPKRKKAPA